MDVNLNSLPKEILTNTFNFLDEPDLLRVMQTCHLFRECVSDTATGILWTAWGDLKPQTPILIGRSGLPKSLTEKMEQELSPLARLCRLIGKNISNLKIQEKLYELEKTAGRDYESQELIDCQLITGKSLSRTQRSFYTVTKELITTWKIDLSKGDIVPQSHAKVTPEGTEITQAHNTKNILILQTKSETSRSFIYRDLEQYSEKSRDFIEPKVCQDNQLQAASTALDSNKLYSCEANNCFFVLYDSMTMSVFTVNEYTRVLQHLWNDQARLEDDTLQSYSDVFCNENALIRKITPVGRYHATGFESLEPLTGNLRRRHKFASECELEGRFWLANKVIFWQQNSKELFVRSIYGKIFPTICSQNPIRVVISGKAFEVIDEEPGLFETIKKTTRLTLRRLSLQAPNISDVLHRGKEVMSSVFSRISHSYFLPQRHGDTEKVTRS